MSLPKARVPIVPRLLSTAEAARYIGKSEQWLRLNRARLEALGFPRPHPVLDAIDRVLLDRFIDRTAGRAVDAARKTSPKAGEVALIERASKWDG